MEIKKVGRPKLENKLTPAKKQANYRLRCAARVEDLAKSVSFEYTVFLEINKAIESVKNRYPLRAGYPCIPERKAALYALEDLRNTLIDKSNVIKIKDEFMP